MPAHKKGSLLQALSTFLSGRSKAETALPFFWIDNPSVGVHFRCKRHFCYANFYLFPGKALSY